MQTGSSSPCLDLRYPRQPHARPRQAGGLGQGARDPLAAPWAGCTLSGGGADAPGPPGSDAWVGPEDPRA